MEAVGEGRSAVGRLFVGQQAEGRSFAMDGGRVLPAGRIRLAGLPGPLAAIRAQHAELSRDWMRRRADYAAARSLVRKGLGGGCVGRNDSLRQTGGRER